MATFAIIEKLGGREAVFNLLKASGHMIKTIHTIRMWVARGSIPSDAQIELMAEADARGISYTASDFKLSDEPRTSSEPDGAAGPDKSACPPEAAA